MAVGSAKVPALVSCALVSTLLGVALGVVGMGLFGYKMKPPDADPSKEGDPRGKMPGGMGGPPGGGMMGGPPGGGMMGGPAGGMMGGMGGGMGGGGRSKAQLATLVTKLDLLTAQPLTLSLTDDQRKALAKETEGLGGMDELSEEEAGKRLDALQAALEKERKTLESVGYRWREAGGGKPAGGMGGQTPPNPFKEGEAAERLKGLQKTLGKGKV